MPNKDPKVPPKTYEDLFDEGRLECMVSRALREISRGEDIQRGFFHQVARRMAVVLRERLLRLDLAVNAGPLERHLARQNEELQRKIRNSEKSERRWRERLENAGIPLGEIYEEH